MSEGTKKQIFAQILCPLEEEEDDIEFIVKTNEQQQKKNRLDNWEYCVIFSQFYLPGSLR